MGKPPFSIDAFAAALGGVSESNTREQIEYIDLSLIDGDTGNFYAMTGIAELASSIEVVGLQQPIRVRTGENGRVTIVSGHRRRAAIALLVEEGRDDLRQVPCIRERAEDSEDMRRLRLIFANSGTRVLTNAEIARQAEEVEGILYRLKEAGHSFPGRMRDQVAAACKVSSTKLAKLKVIREKLEEPFLGQFERSEMTEQAAYALARLPFELQRDVASVAGKKAINGTAAECLQKYGEGYYDKAARLRCPNGRGCDNALGFLKRTAKTQYSWQACDGICCCKCSSRNDCSGACAEAKKLNAADKAEREKIKAKAEEDSRRRTLRYRAESVKNARRILRAVDLCGDLPEDEKLPCGSYSGLVSVATLRKHAADEFKEDFYFYSPMYGLTSEGAVALAKRTGCTTDYLLGLTEEPRASAAPTWRTDRDYPEGRWIVGLFDLGGRTVRRLAYVSDGALRFDDSADAVRIDMVPVRWIALPEDKEG